MLGFIQDLREIDFIFHFMKLSLILYLRCIIIEEVMGNLTGTNYILSILLLS
jgi:hypothetical protein